MSDLAGVGHPPSTPIPIGRYTDKSQYFFSPNVGDHEGVTYHVVD